MPNRLIRHGDTPFGEEIFDIPETQAETVVEPDGVTDDFRGKSVSAIAERLARHRSYCATRSLNLTMPFATIEVCSRLWAGSVLGRRSYRNTQAGITDVILRGRLVGVPLIATDGFEYYFGVIARFFGSACVYGQVLKTRRNDRVVRVERRVKIGTASRLKAAPVGVGGFHDPEHLVRRGGETRTPAMQAGVVNKRLAWSDVFTACGLTLRVVVVLVHVAVTVQPTESDAAELPTRCSPSALKQAA